MNEFNPSKQDAALGGNSPPPTNGAVLGGSDRARIFWQRYKQGNRNFTYADLTGINLSSYNLYKVNLQGANLKQAILAGTNMRRASLSDANLANADLSGAILDETSLYYANLFGADLSNASLFGSDLRGADLHRANLFGANLYGCDLRNAANLTLNQIRSANNWQQAKFDQQVCQKLGLPRSIQGGW
ncbi:pentapeptide repeat protein [Thalassoporum mexicanum PCC 7367]|uniref:pentapeptide repeat-containing protein n=1 Tax=Thalassoporum mexicanum TaxID=3457544 RepID=UPI00029FB5F7|nr:pentapeptide repeat-containing protein [Pseudanabaena sp. PCC 7367]AFY68568.1 pentapeptide repeat protein [Pseudanabaena sp. PCC 7367]